MKIRKNSIPVRITPTVQSGGIVYSTFPSMSACARELHIQESHISEVCAGKRHVTHGYVFHKASKSEAEHTYVCCICNTQCYGWGNDPWPVKN